MAANNELDVVARYLSDRYSFFSLFSFPLFSLFLLVLEGNAAVKTVVLRRGAREIYDTPFNITRKVNISRRGKFKENVVTGATEHVGVS